MEPGRKPGRTPEGRSRARTAIEQENREVVPRRAGCPAGAQADAQVDEETAAAIRRRYDEGRKVRRAKSERMGFAQIQSRAGSPVGLRVVVNFQMPT